MCASAVVIDDLPEPDESDEDEVYNVYDDQVSMNEDSLTRIRESHSFRKMARAGLFSFVRQQILQRRLDLKRGRRDLQYTVVFCNLGQLRSSGFFPISIWILQKA